MSNFEVKIRQSIYTNSMELYFFDDGPNFRSVAKPMELVFEKVEDDKEYEPSLRIPDYLASAFLKAVATALDKNGVRLPSVDRIEGEMEARKDHLEDMRKLVFGGKRKK